MRDKNYSKKEIADFDHEIRRDIMSNSQVICCTNIISGTLKDMYFPTVIIDEATQAIEPATIVSLRVYLFFPHFSSFFFFSSFNVIVLQYFH